MSLVLQPPVEARLHSNQMIWLNTVRPDGRPHSVPVWFLWENSTILIFSKPDNQKIRNLRQNPRVTLALDDTKNGSSVIILEGTAALSEWDHEFSALPAYAEKYRTGLQNIGVPVESFTKLYSQLIRITPTRLVAGQ